ncbi:hypothetical protein [Mycobacterium sp.]|uniref:hypothetical protein n=1 Tax=Mycobacterium sp. TaxID=1785 RepID=UPI002CC49A6E|nr:hypothetical protein [Mycobacterium sp.]HME50364.1 hypothetical protein [Mycobacterium sp.]
MAAPTKVEVVRKYVELLRNDNAPTFTPPLYEVFDETIDVGDWNEIRLWVHVFVSNYAATPVTAAAKLNVQFFHLFGMQLGGGGQFPYSNAVIPWDGFTSYINGYVSAPIIGERLRILCFAGSLPPGPYELFVTYYLV